MTIHRTLQSDESTKEAMRRFFHTNIEYFDVTFSLDQKFCKQHAKPLIWNHLDEKAKLPVESYVVALAFTSNFVGFLKFDPKTSVMHTDRCRGTLNRFQWFSTPHKMTFASWCFLVSTNLDYAMMMMLEYGEEVFAQFMHVFSSKT